MGKPIAGQDQFPYKVGGFLVDGANINGVTYAKKLYIYKQRSYGMYDLQDIDGNIFRFIKIGYQDIDGNMLNYFDVDEDLVKKIPKNTFFLKIQDPSRNIYSFVKIYQWHKCITVEGDYVYRTSDIDPLLSGVLINPTISTIPIGDTLSYKSIFYPSSYKDVDGIWYMNNLNGNKDSTNAEILSSNLNTATVKGLSLGKAVLTFVPNANTSLVSHSIVNVVQDLQTVREFKVVPVLPYINYKNEEEYTLEVVTYPYDAVLFEALDFKITEGFNNSTKTTLVSISDDFKKYTFKTILNPLPPNPDYPTPDIESDIRMENVSFTASMSSPIEHEYTLSDINICSDTMYSKIYEYPGKYYLPPRGLRPNMVWQCKATINGPNQQIYPYISSDEEIATFDHVSGIITTHNKTGSVSFSTKYDKIDGTGTGDVQYILSLNVREDMYDYINCTPNDVDVVFPGQELTVKFTGYRGDLEPVNIPPYTSPWGDYTISSDGVVEVFENATLGSTVYVSPNVTLDYQVITPYNTTGIKPTVRNPDNLLPIKSIYSNDYTYYVRLSNDEENIEYQENIIVRPSPYKCSSYIMQFDSYDDTIVEVIDKERLKTQQYALGGSLYFDFKGLKRGSTEMVISSVSDPSLKITLYLIVY